jgi:hypothetical protein
MRLSELALLYFLVGLGCTCAFLVRRGRTEGLATLVADAALLVPFWPLYGPFVLLRTKESREELPSYLAAREESGSPLSELLPDRELARAIDRRLALARSRVDEIDGLLDRPEFSEREAARRHQELLEAGDDRAAVTAQSRLASIGRLRDLRERFARELTEIEEILAQLHVQAELLRLAGDDEETASRDLVGELVTRIESLDEMLGDEEDRAVAM